MEKKYKVVFFDLDKTLWDFGANSSVAIELLFEEYALERYMRSLEKFRKIYEKENHRMWTLYRQEKVSSESVKTIRFERSLKTIGADPTIGAEMGMRYLEILGQQTQLYPNAIEVLTELKKNYTLGLITNGFEEVQCNKLMASGLDVFFEHVITSETANAVKPNPSIFQFALDKTNVSAHEAIMIGDDYKADIMGAKRINMDQVWFQPHSDNKGKSTYIIKNLDQLLSIVHL